MIDVTLKAANPVEAAILKVRGVSKLALAMGVTRETIRTWRHDGTFPEPWLPMAAKVTGIPQSVLRG